MIGRNRLILRHLCDRGTLRCVVDFGRRSADFGGNFGTRAQAGGETMRQTAQDSAKADIQRRVTQPYLVA